jgi:L-threonylcarbamoyladenylate synthase
VAELATAGLETIAVRVPAHAIAHAILQAFAKPVVAPSANISGHVSPTTAQHVEADLAGKIDLIVDGGPANVGLESTIVGCYERPLLLRPGALARDEIGAVLGTRLGDPPHHDGAGQPLAPGMLASHYAPRLPVRLNATTLEDGEALLAFGIPAVAGVDNAVAVLNLSERADLVQAAANLFGHLRELDRSGAWQIAVMPVPAVGLGEAINDRLRRAAV